MNTGAAPTSPGGTISSVAAERWDRALKAEMRSSSHFTENFVLAFVRSDNMQPDIHVRLKS